MEPIYVLDWGHWTAKCGRVWAGKATTKAAKAAVAAGSSIVAHAPTAALEHSTITSPDLAADFIKYMCSAASTEARSIMNTEGDSTQGSTLVILTPLDMCRVDLEALCHVSFEKLGVKRFHVASSSAMALLATGATSGTVLDAGHLTSRVVPVLDGLPLTSLCRTVPRGGWHQSSALREVLMAAPAPHAVASSSSGRSAPWPAFATQLDELQALHNAKVHAPWSMKPRPLATPRDAGGDDEDAVRDAPSDAPTAALREVSMTLPDGTTFTAPGGVDSRVLDDAAAYIFDTRWSGGHRLQSLSDASLSLLDAAFLTFRECAAAGHGEAVQQVVVAGGPSLVPGCDEAVALALKQPGWDPTPAVLAAAGGAATIRPLNDRVNAPWIGASVLAQLGTFASVCVDKVVYDREGPTSVRYCLV